MFYLKVAGLVIAIDNQYSDIIDFCKSYTADEQDKMLSIGVIRALPEDLKWCKQYFREVEHIEVSDARAERDSIAYALYPVLPMHSAFWLHACVVEVDGEAYAFTAPPGVGKTTHAKLWLKLLGKRARIINGDNPIIRLHDGRFYAYGTPWCGKEGWNVNTGVPLKAVCYIDHGEENALKKLSEQEAYGRLVIFSRYYMTRENTGFMLDLYEQLVKQVPVYQMNCNMTLDAARISYEGMSGKSIILQA